MLSSCITYSFIPLSVPSSTHLILPFPIYIPAEEALLSLFFICLPHLVNTLGWEKGGGGGRGEGSVFLFPSRQVLIEVGSRHVVLGLNALIDVRVVFVSPFTPPLLSKQEHGGGGAEQKTPGGVKRGKWKVEMLFCCRTTRVIAQVG